MPDVVIVYSLMFEQMITELDLDEQRRRQSQTIARSAEELTDVYGGFLA